MTTEMLVLLLLISAVRCDVQRLPGAVRPFHYDLFFAYHFGEEFPFYGLATIKIKAQKVTDKIVLHSKDLVIDDKTTLTGEESIPVKSTSHNNETDFLTIQLEKQMTVNQTYTLSIPFRGNVPLARTMAFGIYVGNYVDTNTGKKENYIATLLEWKYARTMFPCFDEPALKATFRLAVGHHHHYSAVSNMPLLKSTSENPMEKVWPWAVISETFNNMREKSYIWDHFDMSVPMSTYLVALSVNKFSYSETSTKESGVKIRIWSTPDTEKQRAYALKVAPKLVSYYEKMFNIPFALPKLDVVCVPVDVNAMENWGIIIMPTSSSLYDPKKNSRFDLLDISGVIAHEIAHQWFGNLVTMKWWNDLWLKEGFATLLEQYGLAHVEKSVKMWHESINKHLQFLLILDSYQDTYSVIVPENLIQDKNFYGVITYSKASRILRMMSMLLGEKLFRKGMNSYLTKYSYNNADSSEFLSEMEAVSAECGSFQEQSLAEALGSWVKQPGYPLLTINRTYTDNTMEARQARYFTKTLRTSQSWWIPVKVLVEGAQRNKQSDKIIWISNNDGINSGMKIEHQAKSNEWILVNADAIAPMRVNYDQRNWEMLTVSLKKDHQSVPTLSRIQLIHDAFMLAYDGIIDYSIPFDLISYLQYETEDQPLSAGMFELGIIGGMMQSGGEYGAFQKLLRMIITPVYDRVGGLCCKDMKVSKKDLSKLGLQVTAVKEACAMNVPDCEEKAVKMFDIWMKCDDPDKNNTIPIDHRPAVYCVGVSRGSVMHWRFLLARYQKSQSDLEKKTLLSAMTCSRDPWIIRELYQMYLQNGPALQLSLEDMSMSREPVARLVLRPFVEDRIDEIHEKLSNQDFLSLITQVVETCRNKKEVDDIMSLLESKNYINKDDSSIKMTLENAQLRLDWMEQHKTRVLDIIRNMTI